RRRGRGLGAGPGPRTRRPGPHAGAHHPDHLRRPLPDTGPLGRLRCPDLNGDQMTDKQTLIDAVGELAVVRGRVTLASGKEADYYVDMRRVTLDGAASPVVGR